MAKNRMYDDTKTWNPAVGCRFDCIYCKPSFQNIIAWSTKRSGVNCDGCLNFVPHEHSERLSRIPSNDIIFAFGNGDISFYHEDFVKQAIENLIDNLHRSRKKKTAFFQSKNPKVFNKYLDTLEPIKDSVVLATTLETNRDEGYCDVSKAPVPSVRYKDFLALNWHRKIVTIEPVMDFDFDYLAYWIHSIGPEGLDGYA